jgi:hypothetical protein
LDDLETESVRNLDSFIEKQRPITEEATLWRGVTPDVAGKFEVGGVVTDPGYVSTSMSAYVAKGIGGDVLEIRAPAGTRALNIDKLGFKSAEAEILLPRGCKFKVVSKTRLPDSSATRTVLELIP